MKRLAVAAVAMAMGAAPPAFAGAAEDLDALSTRLVEAVLQYDPTTGYFTGHPVTDHRRFADRSPAGMRAFESRLDGLHAEFRRIDRNALPQGDARITYALVKEMLESEQQGRVCRSELWQGVSHMGGWHSGLAEIAGRQPVSTADERAQALERWRAAPRFVDQEIANLRAGLAAGYSSPKSVTRRVIGQVKKLADTPADKSPLASPAERSQDAAFKAAFTKVIAEEVKPALKRYLAFLETEYLPKARDNVAIIAIPRGAECYQASLRGYTTLNRTPREVHDLGAATVAANAKVIEDLGEKRFGTRDFAAIIEKVDKAPDNHFASEQELVDFSAAAVARAKAKSASLFASMPAQEVRVERFREFMRGSGASSYYEMQPDPAKPAYYRINTDNWQAETRGGAEVTAIHEAYPGHHMQLSYARELKQSDIAKLAFNSAYIEGWARYSERLGEEEDMYVTPYAAFNRRAWPARGMVADPALHLFGWTPAQTVDYLASTGRFSRAEAEDLIDRMAIIPGQLTAYDSGGLEIMALRDEAKRELGDRFDLKAFHTVVLGNGVVPLEQLRLQVREWIAEQKAR